MPGTYGSAQRGGFGGGFAGNRNFNGAIPGGFAGNPNFNGGRIPNSFAGNRNFTGGIPSSFAGSPVGYGYNALGGLNNYPFQPTPWGIWRGLGGLQSTPLTGGFGPPVPNGFAGQPNPWNWWLGIGSFGG